MARGPAALERVLPAHRTRPALERALPGPSHAAHRSRHRPSTIDARIKRRRRWRAPPWQSRRNGRRCCRSQQPAAAAGRPRRRAINLQGGATAVRAAEAEATRGGVRSAAALPGIASAAIAVACVRDSSDRARPCRARGGAGGAHRGRAAMAHQKSQPERSHGRQLGGSGSSLRATATAAASRARAHAAAHAPAAAARAAAAGRAARTIAARGALAIVRSSRAARQSRPVQPQRAARGPPRKAQTAAIAPRPLGLLGGRSPLVRHRVQPANSRQGVSRRA